MGVQSLTIYLWNCDLWFIFSKCAMVIFFYPTSNWDRNCHRKYGFNCSRDFNAIKSYIFHILEWYSMPREHWTPFKVNHLHSVLVMMVLVSCSHKYFPTINATSRNKKFAVVVHCIHALKSQVEPYQRIC